MTARPITTFLDDDSLARIDALAQRYGATRDEMIARLFKTGLLATEAQARKAGEDTGRQGGTHGP